MTRYTLVEIVNDSVLLLESRYGVQLFTRVKVRTPRKCAVGCRRQIDKKDLAYRPIPNSKNRSHRICLPCSWRLREEGRDAKWKPGRGAAR